MKKQQSIFSYLFLLMVLIPINSCDFLFNNDQEPTARDDIYFEIDGIPVTPKEEDKVGIPTVVLTYDINVDHFGIKVTVDDETGEYIFHFSQRPVDSIGVYELRYDQHVMVDFENQDHFFVDSTEINFIDISKLDFNKGEIEGTFEFTMYGYDTGIIRKVSNGKFDFFF